MSPKIGARAFHDCISYRFSMSTTLINYLNLTPTL